LAFHRLQAVVEHTFEIFESAGGTKVQAFLLMNASRSESICQNRGTIFGRDLTQSLVNDLQSRKYVIVGYGALLR
jgi:hypothetical protein